MAKATYRREGLTGDLFMVSEDDSRINMAGRHGAGAVTESWAFDPRGGGIQTEPGTGLSKPPDLPYLP